MSTFYAFIIFVLSTSAFAGKLECRYELDQDHKLVSAWVGEDSELQEIEINTIELDNTVKLNLSQTSLRGTSVKYSKKKVKKIQFQYSSLDNSLNGKLLFPVDFIKSFYFEAQNIITDGREEKNIPMTCQLMSNQLVEAIRINNAYNLKIDSLNTQIHELFEKARSLNDTFEKQLLTQEINELVNEREEMRNSRDSASSKLILDTINGH